MIESYQRKMAAPGYATKVPESVQQSNLEKLTAYETEMAATLAAIKGFEQMKM